MGPRSRLPSRTAWSRSLGAPPPAWTNSCPPIFDRLGRSRYVVGRVVRRNLTDRKQKTVDYLFHEVIGESQTLGSVHHFIWDRTRAVRNDFSIQQVTKVADLQTAIACYERIARFHILSLHQLSAPTKPYDKYDWYQEREQLDRTLLSLMQYYDDSRGRLQSPNESEFRAYCVIFQIQDPIPDLEERTNSWPNHVREDNRVKVALKLYAAAGNVLDPQGPLKPRTPHAIARENWEFFWSAVRSPEVSYLMACVAEVYFNLVRRSALHSIWQAYRKGGASKNEDWTTSELVDVLGFNVENQVITFCDHYGFSFGEREDGQTYLDISSVQGKELSAPSAGLKEQMFSDNLVEAKRLNRTFPAIIDGLSFAAAEEAGFLEEVSEAEGVDVGESKDESLFVPDHEPEDEERMEASSRTKTTNNGIDLNPAATAFSPDAAPFQQSMKAMAPTSSSASQMSFGRPSAPAASNVTYPQLPQHNLPESKTPTPLGSSLFAQPKATPPFSFQNHPTTPTTEPSKTKISFGQASALTGQPEKSTATQVSIATPQTNIPAFSITPKSDLSTPNSSLPSFSSKSVFNTKPESVPKEQSSLPTPKAAFQFPQQKTTPTTVGPSANGSTSSGLSFASGKNLATGFTNNTDSGGSSQSQTPTFSFSSPPSFGQKPSTTFGNFPTSFTPTAPSPASLSSSSETSTKIPTTASATPLEAGPTVPTLPPSSTVDPGSAGPSASSSPQPSARPFANLNGKFDLPNSTVSPTSNLLTSKPPNLPAFASTSKSPSASILSRQESEDRKKKADVLDSLAKYVVLDRKRGYLIQFVEFAAEPIIRQAFKMYADELISEEADTFRLNSLATRFGRRWRDVTWHRRLMRQGRERRKRLAKRQRQQKTDLTASLSAVEEDVHAFRQTFKTSTTRSAPLGREIPNGVARSQNSSSIGQGFEMTRSISSNASTQSEDLQPSFNASSSNHVTNGKPRNKHRRSKTHSGASHSLSRPSTPASSIISNLQSSSRNAVSQQSFRSSEIECPRRSTTKTNYFRLKALGIQPNEGENVWDRPTSKRSREDDDDTTSLPSIGRLGLSPAKRLQLKASPPSVSQSQRSLESEPSKVVSTMPPPSRPKSRAEVEAEDEDLFARVRAVKQAMAEGVTFYREQIALERRRRSVSSTGSVISSPSTQKTETPGGSRPKYWSRESKFVPREDYGKGVKRKGKERESPPSRADPDGGFGKPDGVIRPPPRNRGPIDRDGTLQARQDSQAYDFAASGNAQLASSHSSFASVSSSQGSPRGFRSVNSHWGSYSATGTEINGIAPPPAVSDAGGSLKGGTSVEDAIEL